MGEVRPLGSARGEVSGWVVPVSAEAGDGADVLRRVEGHRDLMPTLLSLVTSDAAAPGRIQALHDLGYARGGDAMEALAVALSVSATDPEVRVRRAAVHLIAHLVWYGGVDDATCIQALDHLAAVRDTDPDPSVRLAAAVRLTWHGDTRGVKVLAVAAAHAGVDAEGLRAIPPALLRIGTAEADLLLTRLTDDRYPGLLRLQAWQSQLADGRGDGATALDAIAELGRSGDFATRVLAVTMLAGMAERYPEMHARAVALARERAREERNADAQHQMSMVLTQAGLADAPLEPGILGYDKNAAKVYAHTWWNGANHDCSGYSRCTPWSFWGWESCGYPSQGGDCANFVSQCVVAGGHGYLNGGMPCRGYPCGKEEIGAKNLGDCLVRKGWTRTCGYNQGPPANIQVGDVLILHGGSCGNYDAHATIVTYVNGSDVRVSCHSSNHKDVSYNYYSAKPYREWLHLDVTPPTGNLRVTLGPTDAVNAGARWRVDGGSWRTSGSTASGLSVGSHTVSFNSLGGWDSPGSRSVTVQGGQTATLSATYERQTGSLRVAVEPADAVATGAQWRVDGGAWRAPGDTVSGLAVGSHSVTFSAAPGWSSPEARVVSIGDGQTTTMTGVYVRLTGSVTVTVEPPEAVPAAGWRLGDRAWRGPGEVEAGVPVGSASVLYQGSAAWTPPSPETVLVTDGMLTAVTARFVRTTGRLSMVITSDVAPAADAAWRVNGGDWLVPGVELPDQPTGVVTVDFRQATGWRAPAPRVLEVAEHDLTLATAGYVRLRGGLAGRIAPAGAAAEGRWRIDGGAWRADGGEEEGLPTGTYTVEFLPLADWTEPSPATVEVTEGDTATVTGRYSRHTGSLQVWISPTGAVEAGAAWHRDGGPWQTSGAREDGIPSGSVSLAYPTLPGWASPTATLAVISHGLTTEVAALYLRTNHAPIITVPDLVHVRPGASVGFEVGVYDPETNACTLTWTGAPPGAVVSVVDGRGLVYWMAEASRTGEVWTMAFTACDAGGGCTTAEVAVRVGSLPALTGPGAVTALAGRASSVLYTAHEADGDDLAWSADGLPEGMALLPSGSDATLTLAIDPSLAGTCHTVQVAVTDRDGGDVLPVRVYGRGLPVVACATFHEADPGELVMVPVTATDPDGEGASLQALGLPEGASFSSSGGQGVLMVQVGASREDRLYRIDLAAADGDGIVTACVHVAVGDPVTDNDGNALPDVWELRHYGAVGACDPGADDDADGQRNYAELRAGTDPRSDRSVWTSDPMARSGGTVVLSWPSVSGRWYRVRHAASLSDGFQPWRTNLPATPPLNRVTGTPPDGITGFFDIEIEETAP